MLLLPLVGHEGGLFGFDPNIGNTVDEGLGLGLGLGGSSGRVSDNHDHDHFTPSDSLLALPLPCVLLAGLFWSAHYLRQAAECLYVNMGIWEYGNMEE